MSTESSLLLYEDGPFRTSVRAVMVEHGLTVRDVSSAAEAVATASTTRPSVVVVDAEMSGARGVSIVADLRAASPGCEVLVISSFDGLRFPALEAGACGFISKADLRELRRCLERM